MSKLSERAVLVKLSLHKWGAEITDNKANDRIHGEESTDKKFTKAYKKLISPKVMNRIFYNYSKLYKFHTENTLPWADGGWRLLPTEAYFNYISTFNGLKSEAEKLVNEMVQNYTTLRGEAKEHLKSLFNEGDYPNATELASKFDIELVVSPVPSDTFDIRVGLTEDQVADIQNELTERFNDQIKEAQLSLFDKLESALDYFYSKVSRENSHYVNKALDDLENLVNLIPKLNFNNNENLTKACDTIRKEICSLSSTSLHKDDKLRQGSALKAKMLQKMVKQLRGVEHGQGNYSIGNDISRAGQTDTE